MKVKGIGTQFGFRLSSIIPWEAHFNEVLLKIRNPTGKSAYERVACITLTHWGWVTHLCIGKLTIIGSDNGLSPGRRQAIIWTNAGILSIGPLGTNFSDIFIEMHTFSFKKMHLKMSSGKWRPFCVGLNVLNILFGAQTGILWENYCKTSSIRHKKTTLKCFSSRLAVVFAQSTVARC